MATAEVNGVELYYVRTGAGAPCLVVHGGLGADHTQYHPWLDPLGDVLRLVYYDQRCNGRSGCPSLAALTMEDLTADADALREHLGVERIAVLGHSYGATVAKAYALRYPHRLSHLILVSSGFTIDFEAIAAGIERAAPTLDVRAAMAEEPKEDAGFGRQVEAMAPLYMHRYTPDLARRFFGRTRWSLAALQRGDEIEPDLTVRLSEITAPKLILTGRHDPFIPVEQAERLAAAIPRAELVIFEESSHMPYLDEPEAFGAAVRSWLRHVEASA